MKPVRMGWRCPRHVEHDDRWVICPLHIGFDPALLAPSQKAIAVFLTKIKSLTHSLCLTCGGLRWSMLAIWAVFRLDWNTPATALTAFLWKD